MKVMLKRMKNGVTQLVLIAGVSMFAASNASAQLEGFVIQGPAAERILEKNALSIDAAKRIAAVCADSARERGTRAAIAIVDQFGLLVYFERMDGIRGQTQVDAAIRKAKTSLITGEPSRAIFNRIQSGQNTDYHWGRWYNAFKTPGGLPIIVDHQLLGAIGVGGSGFDEECAHQALTAIIGVQPPLLQSE
nr:MAG: heme-binding protein [Hyphomicrobiales bacterium]